MYCMKSIYKEIKNISLFFFFFFCGCYAFLRPLGYRILIHIFPVQVLYPEPRTQPYEIRIAIADIVPTYV